MINQTSEQSDTHFSGPRNVTLKTMKYLLQILNLPDSYTDVLNSGSKRNTGKGKVSPGGVLAKPMILMTIFFHAPGAKLWHYVAEYYALSQLSIDWWLSFY